MIRLLAIGDVTSPAAVAYLGKTLWTFRREHGVDFTVVNGENASFISGASAELLSSLLDAGADVVTGGNHTMGNSFSYRALDDVERALRPVNYPAEAPGHGYTIADAQGYRMLVINALGTAEMAVPLDNPFAAVEAVLRREEGKYDLALLDFHAEATGEKVAMGYAFDGRIACVYGTHTHVPTADERLLPHGTAYITDIGMCGETEGVIGMETSCIIDRFRLRIPKKYVPAAGPVRAEGILVDLDPARGVATRIERVRF